MRKLIGGAMMLGALQACGDANAVVIRGDFADTAAVPSSVIASESGRDADVRRGAFSLGGLSAGPATLRLVRGADSSAVLALGALPAGARLALHGIRIDSATGRAFPRSVELTGAGQVMVNGVRMVPDAALPSDVDAHGTVLAASRSGDAVLVRPDMSSLPDLRVAVTTGTQTITADGNPVSSPKFARGDSLRVQGRMDHGFVVASRITVPRRPVPPPTAAASGVENARGSAASSNGGDDARADHGRGRGRGHRKHKFLFFRI